jgi:hypothetical protein
MWLKLWRLSMSCLLYLDERNRFDLDYKSHNPQSSRIQYNEPHVPISPASLIMSFLTRVPSEREGKKTSLTIVVPGEDRWINSVLLRAHPNEKRATKNVSRNNTTRVYEHPRASSSSSPINRLYRKNRSIRTSNLALLPSPRGLSQQQREAIRPAQTGSNVNHKNHSHLVNSVFEKIFSIGTSCFLHQAAVILRMIPIPRQYEQERELGDEVTHLGSR